MNGGDRCTQRIGFIGYSLEYSGGMPELERLAAKQTCCDKSQFLETTFEIPMHDMDESKVNLDVYFHISLGSWDSPLLASPQQHP